MQKKAAVAPPNGEIVAKTCFGQLLQHYDSDMGGFSKAPKFPQAVNFNFLFTFNAANPKDDKAKQGLKMTLHTLDMMAKGGIHDHISQVLNKILYINGKTVSRSQCAVGFFN